MLEDPSSDPGGATQRCQAQHTQVGHTAAEGQVRQARCSGSHAYCIIGMLSMSELLYGHAKRPNLSLFFFFFLKVEAEQACSLALRVIRVGQVHRKQKSVRL